jgi:hypothetical protein
MSTGEVSQYDRAVVQAGAGSAADRPQLIFFVELEGPALHELLLTPGLCDHLVTQRHAVALALPRLDDGRAQAVRLLNAHDIPVVAWLLLPPEDGSAFNLQNYPQAVACYRAFHAWALEHALRFAAVGLDIEPPPVEVARGERWTLREVARRLWLASENVLYPSAHAAYTELVAAIRHDGYEVHTYQMPFIADDRRAGTTLVQRALDIMDLPSDMDVLMCSSCVPIDWLDYDLGGALIASYGPSADAIGIGSIGEASASEEPAPPLPWSALRRDLLLAAHYTDTLYIFTLEDCVRRGLLERIATLDWGAEARAVPGKRALVGALRGVLLALLIAARFGRTALAWTGWALAAALWLRGRRARRARSARGR